MTSAVVGPVADEVADDARGVTDTVTGILAEAPLAKLAALPGVSTASGVAIAAEQAGVTGQVLPVRPGLRELLPAAGLRRGSTVAVRGSVSVLLSLLAEATATGSWAAAVGMPDLGLAAAAEIGVELGRLALVPRPGAEFAAVTAALLDGMDLVAVARANTEPSVARRLSARARHRGAVLLSFGSWPGAELELSCGAGNWTGPAAGSGYLRARRVEITAVGRGSAARSRRAVLTLPGGGVASPAPAVGWAGEPVGGRPAELICGEAAESVDAGGRAGDPAVERIGESVGGSPAGPIGIRAAEHAWAAEEAG